MKMIKSFLRDESGAETIEYVIVVGLICALATLAYASGLGTTIASRLSAMVP